MTPPTALIIIVDRKLINYNTMYTIRLIIINEIPTLYFPIIDLCLYLKFLGM